MKRLAFLLYLPFIPSAWIPRKDPMEEALEALVTIGDRKELVKYLKSQGIKVIP
jgi:hypothetical protein